jgi:hypothetical protein
VGFLIARTCYYQADLIVNKSDEQALGVATEDTAVRFQWG